MQFDHIGIIVENLQDGRDVIGTAFSIREWTQEFRDPGIGVWVQFGRDPSGICYELVAPLTEQSPVSRALARGVNVINHVAYLTSDLAAQARRLRAQGFAVVGPPTPAVAYGGASIQFFLSPNRMLVELIDAPEHVHTFSDATNESTQ